MNVAENQKPDEVTRMYVALPTRLANNIKSLAVREHRSLTGQVVRLLERGMEAEGQGAQS